MGRRERERQRHTEGERKAVRTRDKLEGRQREKRGKMTGKRDDKKQGERERSWQKEGKGREGRKEGVLYS